MQQEREHYEYIISEGKVIHKQSGEPLDTRRPKGTKWIFVMSTAKKLYAGKVIMSTLYYCLTVAPHSAETILCLCYISLLLLLLNLFLYIHQKQRGVFQHSSFLAGGATIAAGRFTAESGVIKVFF